MIVDNDFGYLKYEKQGRIKLIVKKSLLIGTVLFSITAFIYITISAYYFVYHDQNDDKIKIIKSPEEPIKEMVSQDENGIIVKDMDKAVYENLVGNKREELEKTSLLKSPTAPNLPPHQDSPVQESTRLINNSQTDDKNINVEDSDMADVANMIKDDRNESKNSNKRNSSKVQIAAMNSKHAVEEYWSKLNSQYPQLFSNLNYSATKVDLGKKGVVYRLQIGSFENQIKAEEFCIKFIAQTKKTKNDCIMVE